MEVFKNPTRKEYNQCVSYGEARAFIVGDDLYIWPVFSAVHQMVREHLNLPLETAVPVIIHGEYGGEIYVTVTDNSRKAPFHETNEAASLIRKCAFLNRMFKLDDIGYYNEDIVGSW